MNALRMAALFGFAALLGNLTVDWLTHAKPEPVELIGASIIGLILALGYGFRTRGRSRKSRLHVEPKGRVSS